MRAQSINKIMVNDRNMTFMKGSRKRKENNRVDLF